MSLRIISEELYDLTNFHKLISISVRLSKALRSSRKTPNPKAKETLYALEKELKQWLDNNVQKDGIVKDFLK